MKELENTPRLPLSTTQADSHGKIVRLPLAALAGGTIHPGNTDSRPTRRSLWYALYFPQLADLPTEQQDKYLHELAALAENLSSTVSLHAQALVFELRSSLKYFGGINAVHARLGELIRPQLSVWQLPEKFLYAASPTVTGSLLLARAGGNTLVYRKDNLRSALGRLPTAVLDLDREQGRRLHNMGVRYLRDIWRLPTDGLRKRFGSNFVNRLNKALGKAPEPTHNYQPPPAFITSYDLPHEVENLLRLLPVVDELVAQLCDFLRRRDLSTSQIQCSLLHEQQSPTLITIGLRQPSRQREHLMLLLETHFNKLSLPAAVIALKLEVKKFDAFMTDSAELLSEGRPAAIQYSDDRLSQFMEQLQARLGEHCLKTVHSIAEHCPEYSSAQEDCYYSHGSKSRATAALSRSDLPRVTHQPRPFWLLAEPRQLVVRDGSLYYHRAIQILSGPERIETRWWSGSDQRRDYYVATEERGGRLWIYHEKTAAQRWFLHGLFA